ncbi:uncharacterized protein LOC141910238 [Tubulanus polymorphus]|uniref:uncharacterized protein LOC141910238 n=1 Tax=Tubulanus polymorphus TaxID=672921 RepID=UPI003DA4731F
MAPTTASPTTMAPTTASPTTMAPTTASPTTMASTTASPTTMAPTTASPTTMASTTASPTTMAPTTASSTTMVSTTASPTTMVPTTASPTTMVPTTASPTTMVSTTASPTTMVPTTASPTTMAPTTNIKDCSLGRYRCASGLCIMKEWLCDGQEDCPSGEDEKNCVNCEFTCKNYQCIRLSGRCNGVYDCSDRSDEFNCLRIQSQPGAVQIYRSIGVWLPLCMDKVDRSFADSVCREIGAKSVNSYGSMDVGAESRFMLKSTATAEVNLTVINESNNCPSGKLLNISCSQRSCGKPNSNLLAPYVVNGQDAAEGRWPWQVALFEFSIHVCGASLISERTIITAAHCITKEYYDRPDLYEVRLGTKYRSKPKKDDPNLETRKIANIRIHPSFHEYRDGFDIAILILETPVAFTDYILPICVPDTDHVFPPSSICYISGWGQTDFKVPEKPEILKEAKMRLVTTAKCNGTEMYKGRVPHTAICAGYNSGHISICPGDSGGPLQCKDRFGNWFLAGVASFMTQGCNVPMRPSVFTNVTQMSAWIATTSDPCQFICDNGKCLIDTGLLCNRKDDCGDNSDEIRLCDVSVSCQFEDSFLCGYSLGNDPLQWLRMSGPTSTTETGPQADHTTGNSTGYYMYIESSMGQPGDGTLMWSPEIRLNETSCLMFYYHMYGKTMGSLSVLTKNATSMYQKWTVSGNRGNEWRLGQVNLEPGNIRVGFHAIRGGRLWSDIALDDVKVTSGVCPPFDCGSQGFKCRSTDHCISKTAECDTVSDCADNSDEDQCGWSPTCDMEASTICGYRHRTVTQRWKWSSGAEIVGRNGPSIDHTFANETGHFLYWTSKDNPSSSGAAAFESIPYEVSGTTCLQFYYMMYGDSPLDMAELSVHYLGTANKLFTMWRSTFNLGEKWRYKELYLTSLGEYRIVFQVKKQSSSDSNSVVAVDDIKLTKGFCKKPEKPEGYWPCASGDEFIPDSKHCDSRVDCLDASDETKCNDFSKYFNCFVLDGKKCLYVEGGWKTNKGNTPTTFTGPGFDHTTPTGTGGYYYMEASDLAEGASLKFRSRARFTVTVPACLRFAYHMYGVNMGTLQVRYRSPTALTTPFWSISGNQGSDWHYAQTELPLSGVSVNIVIEGIRGDGDRSDMAIDDIGLDPGRCPAYRCPKENQFTCENLQCIPVDQVCDSRIDCYDQSDEKNCSCNANEFQCRMGMCIPTTQVCDRIEQCPDGSDELNCTCEAGKTGCVSDGECLLNEWFCDRELDCKDGSDETNCSNCKPGEYVCRDYSCVDSTLRCNGVANCKDGSDEFDCFSIDADSGILRALVGGKYIPICTDDWNTSLTEMVGETLAKGKLLREGSLVASFQGPFARLITGSAAQFTEVITCQRIVTAEYNDLVCGKASNSISTSYVLNGRPATAGKWPWTVSLRLNNQHICGGTLVGKDLVLTAGHCIKKSDPISSYTVALGTTKKSHPDGNRVTAELAEIWVHPHYTKDLYDMAALRLKRPLNFTDRIRPACLPGREREMFTSSSICYTIGWGDIDSNGGGTEDLQEGKMKLISLNRCNSSWHGTIHDVQLCAGYESGTMSVCQGDSGGPLVCQDSAERWTLVGITSFFHSPNGCGNSKLPNGFSDVKKLLASFDSAFPCAVQCGNGQCIYGKEHKCDNITNCQDKADESGCPACSADEFVCGNGTDCVSSSRVCDGFPDCPNGRDEHACFICRPGDFKCATSHECVSREARCDGRINCTDRSDELNCPEACKSGQYLCKSSGRCIGNETLCNEIADCDDLTDELGCDCSGKFVCANGLCLTQTKRCNGFDECGDNSDESNCTCLTNESMCPGGGCILNEWKCDGYNDCKDGWDELNCSSCQSADQQFTCTDYTCVAASSRCDGVRQCTDGSDERDCVNIPTTTVNSSQDAVQVWSSSGVYLPLCASDWNATWADDLCQLTGKGKILTQRIFTDEAYGGKVARIPTGTRKLPSIGGYQVSSQCNRGRFVRLTCKPKGCGKRDSNLRHVSPYMIGGDLALAGEYPWMASLYFHNTFRCGASLVSSEWLVTAAHCFGAIGGRQLPLSIVPQYFSVFLGTIVKNRAGAHGQRVPVRKIIVHPVYTKLHGLMNDIALVRLARPVPTTSYIEPICLPDDLDFQRRKSSLCYVSGWGSVDQFSEIRVPLLRDAKMRLRSDYDCKKAYGDKVNTSTALCAGYSHYQITACGGDSGSPLVCLDGTNLWRLVGVVSGGVPCEDIDDPKSGRAGKPDVYTRVSAFQPWIRDTISAHV